VIEGFHSAANPRFECLRVGPWCGLADYHGRFQNWLIRPDHVKCAVRQVVATRRTLSLRLIGQDPSLYNREHSQWLWFQERGLARTR
jgi:hypothetical protein